MALAVDASGKVVRRVETGPANLRLLTDTKLWRRLAEVARECPAPDAVAICLAGARNERDWARMREAAARVWPGVPCHATNDLESALSAGQSAEIEVPRVLVLSGTGSCCYGRAPEGRTAKIGGWGHILGDKGSGFEIGLRALKAVVYYLDRDGVWSSLGQRLLRKLQLNSPDDLIGWVQQAGKEEIAALALEVFQASQKRDRIAQDILKGAAHSLAKDAVACAKKLAPRGGKVEFVFVGGVLIQQPRFRRQIARLISEQWGECICVPLSLESVWGAVMLGRKILGKTGIVSIAESAVAARARHEVSVARDAGLIPGSSQLSPTESRNSYSRRLSQLSYSAAVRLMLREEGTVAGKLFTKHREIEKAVALIVTAIKSGGRLFYFGAGTSGRLGVLDASECPPTFRTPPDLVQGVIAGGRNALWQAVEGAEDDAPAGAAAVEFRAVSRKDVVVGIAASGRTPFVWGALQAARVRGAMIILVTFNPYLEFKPSLQPDVVIDPDLGPEILTGSTRLKCGTATKLVLNIFTTLAMTRLGKVIGNLMVDLNPSNMKLRDRAVRILRELTGSDEMTARRSLEQERWVVARAWERLRR